MDTYMKFEVGYCLAVRQGTQFRQKHTDCVSAPGHGLGLITLLLREGLTSVLQ